MTNILIKIAGGIDRLNTVIGKTAALTMPLIVIVGAGVAALRYAFKLGFPWLSESFVWLNGAALMLAAAWVLASEQHVRVDVFYNQFSAKTKAIVDIVGTIVFLWPTLFIVAYFGYPGLKRSWSLLESSPTVDGLPFLYLLKSTILLFCVLLALQGLALVCRSILALSNGSPAPLSTDTAGQGR